MQETYDTVDHSRKWHVMAAVAMGISLVTIDSSIVNVALPTLVRAFHTDFPTVQWVVLSYLLTLTTLMLSVGRLADMRGKKPIYQAGFVVFLIGSSLCGFAPSIYWLIGARVLQAVGATMVTALGMAIITEAFPASERGRALGLNSAIVSVGISLGPTLGGLLINALSWRWIFFVNVPIGLLGIFLVGRNVPNVRPKGGERFDFPGAILLFISLLTLLLGLTVGQNRGFADRTVLLLLVTSVLVMIVFILVELRTREPMIDLHLFQNQIFSVNLLTRLITFITMAGAIILMPFYLETILQYDIRKVGLLLAAMPVGVGLAAPLAGALSDRFGPYVISIVGLSILLIGYLGVSTLSTETTVWAYVIRFFPIGLGMGTFQSPNNSAVMGAAPRERLGIASGTLSLIRTLGQTIGIAVVGAIWASRTFFHAGAKLAGGATEAPPQAQVWGMRDAFLVLVALIALALCLAIWSYVREHGRAAAAVRSQPLA